MFAQLPGCRKTYRDLVGRHLEETEYFRLSERDIRSWVALVARQEDIHFSGTLEYLPERQWVLVVRHGESFLPVGWAAWHENTLQALYVTPSHRKLQIGRNLLELAVTIHGKPLCGLWTQPSLRKMASYLPFKSKRSPPESYNLEIRLGAGREGVVAASEES